MKPSDLKTLLHPASVLCCHTTCIVRLDHTLFTRNAHMKQTHGNRCEETARKTPALICLHMAEWVGCSEGEAPGDTLRGSQVPLTLLVCLSKPLHGSQVLLLLAK